MEPMPGWFRYLADLHAVLPPHWAGAVLVGTSLFCGFVLGAEREAKRKAAGLRTLMLICVGSTIFTLVSVLLAGTHDDRTRVAAQVVTGVGFLGAGAIIRHRGAVIGLTTGATIWTVAAIGLVVGSGYAAAGVALTLAVFLMLVVVGRFEARVLEPCCFAGLEIRYRPEAGKTRVRLLRVLDEHLVAEGHWSIAPDGENQLLRVRYCHVHRVHRSVLYELAEVPGVLEIHMQQPPRRERTPSGETQP